MNKLKIESVKDFAFGLLAAFILVAVSQIIFMVIDSHNASKDIEACKSVGGEPIYDLCAKHIELIKIPGVDYSPEVDQYK